MCYIETHRDIYGIMEQLLFKTSALNFKIKSGHLEDENDKFFTIEGLASTFGNLDRQGDIIVKGAFAKTLGNSDIQVQFLHQHNPSDVLGRIDHIRETDDGLFLMARMPKNIDIVRNLMPLLDMGAIGKFSIGFNVIDTDVSPDGNRLIKEIELHEVSVVTFAANNKANITSVKKDVPMLNVEDIECLSTRRDFEKMFMNTGIFTRKASNLLASLQEKQRDAVDEHTRQRDAVECNLAHALVEMGKLKQYYNIEA